MRAGQALTDEDRLPWLQRLAQLLLEHVQQDRACVVACSALRRRYRDVLTGRTSRADGDDADRIAFVGSPLCKAVPALDTICMLRIAELQSFDVPSTG